MSEVPSKSQVKKAGRTVRHAARRRTTQTAGPSAQEFMDALEVIRAHRATFRTPLVSANNGLRSMVKTLGLDGRVSQRLKRMQTIVNKLVREPMLSLDTMQDIGGCRVVLPSRSDVYALAERLGKVRPPVRVSDYIAEPRQSGYRSLHVIVEYGDPPRPIEIQLRTGRMHTWATTVEDLSGNQGINYKMDGTSAVQVFLECYARFLECFELGQKPGSGLIDEYERLYAQAFKESA